MEIPDSQLEYMDDIVLLSGNAVDIQKELRITIEFCKFSNITINTKKSVYAWKSTNPAPINKVAIEAHPIKRLGEAGHYQYLEVWINIKLDWTMQQSKSTYQYRQLVKVICDKHYLYNTNQCLWYRACFFPHGLLDLL